MSDQPTDEALSDAYESGLAEGRAEAKAQTCATCQHYSGEHCADTRPLLGRGIAHVMVGQLCPPSFGCNQWEARK